MSYTNPNTHRLASASHTSTSSSGYQADLYKFREEMANILKSKLGVDLSSSRLYQKPYMPEFDFVSYLLVGVFPILLNLTVMILVQLGNMLVNIWFN